MEEYLQFNVMAYERVKAFIKNHANDEKPFLLDWWPNMIEFISDENKPKTTPHGSVSAESFARFDRKIGEIVAMLEELGITSETNVRLWRWSQRVDATL
jgi:hypothetical protein